MNDTVKPVFTVDEQQCILAINYVYLLANGLTLYPRGSGNWYLENYPRSTVMSNQFDINTTTVHGTLSDGEETYQLPFGERKIFPVDGELSFVANRYFEDARGERQSVKEVVKVTSISVHENLLDLLNTAFVNYTFNFVNLVERGETLLTPASNRNAFTEENRLVQLCSVTGKPKVLPYDCLEAFLRRLGFTWLDDVEFLNRCFYQSVGKPFIKESGDIPNRFTRGEYNYYRQGKSITLPISMDDLGVLGLFNLK